jgi:hypothetical protein
MTAEIHGGWTMDNCKQALNEFCQKNRLPAREYKITKIGSDNSRFIKKRLNSSNSNTLPIFSTIVAENQIFLPQLKRSFFLLLQKYN